jgi:hypothetical protein
MHNRGYTISKGDGYVIREHIDKKGNLSVYVHAVDKDGKEQIPNGYVLGINMIHYKK